MEDNRDAQRNQRRRGQHHRKSSSKSKPHRARSSNHAARPPMAQTYLSTPESTGPAVLQVGHPTEQMEYEWDMGRSEDVGTGTFGSYCDSGTNYAITDDTNSSWLVVQQHQHYRTNSNESNRTSGGTSEGSGLSTPSESKPGWTWGAAFAVERDFVPFTGQEHPLLLSGLSKPVLKTPYHTVKHVMNNRIEFEELVCQENMDPHNPPQSELLGANELPVRSVREFDGSEASWNHNVHSEPSRTTELPLRSLDVYDGAEASWNHLEHRVPNYNPGFTVFAPLSPSDSLLNETPASPPEDNKSKSPEKKHRSPRTAKSTKGKGIATLEWEHTVVIKGGLARVSEHPHQEPIRRSGCRKGKLHPDTKEKARRVRRVGACWPCRVLKVPCSEGEVCERCKKQASKCSPTADQLCIRAGFADYDEAFFGKNLEYLHSHLDRRNIKDLINEHASNFTDTEIPVEVLTGQCFEPMKLLVHVFQPKDFELLRLHQVTAVAEMPSSQLVCSYSAPVGMMAFSTSETKGICKDHIEKMIKNPKYALQTTAGDPTEVPFLILEAILKYCFNANIPLLRNALMLHACHYFMGRLITFSDETAEIVHQTVDPYGAPREPFLSSRLLNRQIKFAMHKLHREIMKDVLDSLEKSMKSRTKDSWASSFCTILLLCLCIEGLQTAADTFVVCDIFKSESEGTTSQYSRDQSFTACQDLDNYPFHQSIRLFHDFYRSHRESNSGAREGFNPLRSIRSGAVSGLDQQADAMIKEINWALNNYYSEIQGLSQKPILVDNGFRAEPREIKANNTGRLASKFLMSFLPSQT